MVQIVPQPEDTVPNNMETYFPYEPQVLPGPSEYNAMEPVGIVYPQSHNIQPVGYSGYSEYPVTANSSCMEGEGGYYGYQESD